MNKPSKKVIRATEQSHAGLVGNTEQIENGRHTFDLAKGADTARRLKSGEDISALDNPRDPVVQSGFSVFNPVFPSTLPKEPKMARAPAKSKAVETDSTPAANTVIDNGDGTTTTLNPTPEKTATVQEQKEAAAKAKIEAEAAKLAEKEAKAAEREAAKAAKLAEREATAEQRAKTKEERQAALAALAEGRNYTGSMLALSQRVKDGIYVKSATGQLRSQNPLAEALDGVAPNGVIQTGMEMLNLEANPYAHLNVGQQSMNLRNKMRGAINKGIFTVDDVIKYVADHDLDSSESIAKEKADRAAKAAEAKADREAKAEAKAAADKQKAETAKTPEAETA